MADDQTYSADMDGLRAAADALAAQREAEVQHGPQPIEQPVEPPPAEPVEKIRDYDTEPISHRKAAERMAELRETERLRAANYGTGQDAQWQAPQAQQPAAPQPAPQQPAQPPPAQPAPDAVQTGIAELTSQEHQLAVHEQTAAAYAQAAWNEFTQRYADLVGTGMTEQQFAQANPARYQQYLQDSNVVSGHLARLQQTHQAREQATAGRMAAEFDHAANAEDARFMQMHPELVQNPEQFREVQKATLKYFADKGIPEQLLMEHWGGKRSFSLREAITQDVVLDAVRWRMSQDRLAQYRDGQRGQKLPPVLKPGTPPDPGEYTSDQIASVKRALGRASGTEAIRLAVQLQRLQRPPGGTQ